MRNGQNKRMRGRNRRGHNPLTRVYESNGPDVKIRGTAHHVAEKYLQLARDAQSSGDPVAAESYLQYAEHYFRLIAAAQAQFAPQNQQNNPNQPQQPFQRSDMEARDEFDDEGDEAGNVDSSGQPYPSGAPVQQMQQPRPQHQHQPQPNFQGYQQHQPRNDEQRDPGLPAFITGGGGQPPQPGNGYDNEQGGDRDNRRFHRGRNRRFNRGRNDYEPRGPQAGGMPPQTAPVEAQPGGEFTPSKPEE
jgi:hypothetical protein